MTSRLLCPRCGAHADGVRGVLRCERDGAAFVTEQALRKGDGDPILGATLAGGFVALELVATGSTAGVYRGLGPEDAPVALKVARADAGSAARDAFARETAALAGVGEARHLVRLVAHGEVRAPEGWFVALAWLDGGTLAARLAHGTPGAREALAIARDVALGLGELHDRGFVHGDVKPSNVIVTPEGGAVLVDLGSSARTGQRAGSFTPAFASPEQIRGEPLDPRADLYALGRLLARLLEGKGEGSGAARFVDDPAPTLLGRADRLGPLGALIDALTAPAPGDRPREAAGVVEALQEALA